VELERTSVLNRTIWSFVWFAIISIGMNAFASWGAWWGYGVIGPLVTLIGVSGMVANWTLPTRHHRGLEHLTMLASLLTLAFIQGPAIAVNRFYNTDAAAFNQRAAQLLMHGINPYGVKLSPGYLTLNHVADYWTYTMSGGYVDHVSYPAGSFLFQVPFEWLGVHHLTTNWVDLVAWLGAGILLYRVSPWYTKWLAPLLLLATELTYVFTNGGTDALFVPFMMIAALRWDDFVTRSGPRWSRWLGPVSLGVACSIKQTPWFTVPFFVVGICLEARHHEQPVVRTTLRYSAWVFVTFLVINLPFIIWSPLTWIKGTLLPMSEPLVPDGQGLVGIVLHGLVRGLHPSYLQLASFLLLLSLLAAFVTWYPVLKRSWMFAVPLVLYVPSRSLSTYLIDFIPAAFVLALTTQRVPAKWASQRLPRIRLLAIAIPALFSVAAAVWSFSSPTLTITPIAYGSSHFNQYINPMIVSIKNNTDQTVTPHVMVEVGSSHPVGFWHQAKNAPITLAPHQTRIVTLFPPLYMGAPQYQETWLVEALTSSPNSLSVTPAYEWKNGKKYY
jgi:uncharacterized membrane protein